MIYSVFKERDFATNFLEGEYKESGLGDVVRSSLAATEPQIFFEDYQAYAPSNGAPASFIGSPIIDRRGNIKGVVAFQMPAARIDAIMRRTSGLGDTGDAYLVGSDMMLRSNPIHGGLDRILVDEMNNPSSRNAIAGETGLTRETRVVADTGTATEHLAAYRPISFYGSDWALIVEQTVTKF